MNGQGSHASDDHDLVGFLSLIEASAWKEAYDLASSQFGVPRKGAIADRLRLAVMTAIAWVLSQPTLSDEEMAEADHEIQAGWSREWTTVAGLKRADVVQAGLQVARLARRTRFPLSASTMYRDVDAGFEALPEVEKARIPEQVVVRSLIRWEWAGCYIRQQDFSRALEIVAPLLDMTDPFPGRIRLGLEFRAATWTWRVRVTSSEETLFTMIREAMSLLEEIDAAGMSHTLEASQFLYVYATVLSTIGDLKGSAETLTHMLDEMKKGTLNSYYQELVEDALSRLASGNPVRLAARSG